MKIKQYAAFALMGLALGACNKPGGEGPDSLGPDEGKTGRLKLSFALPDKIGTYAPGDGDDNATDAEVAVDYIDVFIYDDGGGFGLTHETILAADMTQGPVGTPNVWTLDDPIPVRPGRKQVYVGVNLPSYIVNRLVTGHYVNESFASADPAAGDDDLVRSTGHLAFFNADLTGDVHIVDVPETGTPTPFSVNVSRLVAKIIVKEGSGLSKVTSGGVVSDLQFTIGQRNDSIYVMPLEGLVDPNFENGAGVGELEDPVDDILYPYVQVNPSTLTSADWGAVGTNKVYAPENTVDGSVGAQHQDVTYVSVRAKFTPNVWDDGGTPDASGEFWAVFTGSDDDEGLGQRYFTTEAAADQFIIDNPSIAATDAPSHYVNGHCYYRLYLNPDSYNILRNNLYEATITHINYIGTPTPDMLPGSAGSPTHPTFPGGYELAPAVTQTDVIENIPRNPIGGSVQISEWEGLHQRDYELQ